MARGLILDLADCSKFRQTIAMRPPRIVHGAAILLLGLMTAAGLWAALVRANLVVRATGRVRSMEVPAQVFAPAFSGLTGRVVEAPFQEGDSVNVGEVLVRLDTAQIENRMERLQQTLAAAEKELAMLTGLETLLAQELSAAKRKTTAELEQAEAALARAQDLRSSAVRSGEATVHAARDVVLRMQPLRESGVVAEEQFVKAEAALREAEEKLVSAKLPVDQGSVRVARGALELIDREFAVRCADAQARRVAKEGELAAARQDLRQLELQRHESVLRSPIDGVIVSGQIDPGDVLEPGKPVLKIAPRDGYRFETTIASEDVGQVKVGMPVRIRFDAYDYQQYGSLEGRVAYISPDSRPIEQPTGHAAGPAANSAAYLVRIEMQANEVGRGSLRGAIKLGLGGTADIITDRESLLVLLFKRIRHTIALG